MEAYLFLTVDVTEAYRAGDFSWVVRIALGGIELFSYERSYDTLKDDVEREAANYLADKIRGLLGNGPADEEPDEPTRKPKYLILPGLVYSRNDRARYFITSSKLMELYGVDPRECVIGRSRDMWPSVPQGIDTEGLIELRPRRDGDYSLPEH